MPKYEQNKTELTFEAITGLRAEAAAQRRSMKEVASELILAGLSPASRAFVASVCGSAVEVPARPKLSERDIAAIGMPEMQVDETGIQTPKGPVNIQQIELRSEELASGGYVESEPLRFGDHQIDLVTKEAIKSGESARDHLVRLTKRTTGPQMQRPKIESVPGLPERILALKSEGKGNREIGALVGYSKSAIGNFLNRVKEDKA